MSELLLADCTGGVDLVSEDEERNLGELLDAQEGVELGLALRETLNVGRVDQEDDAIHLREVVAPQTAGWKALRVRTGRNAVRDQLDSPCWCPPRSYVVNFTLPMASSSDAVQQNGQIRMHGWRTAGQ